MCNSFEWHFRQNYFCQLGMRHPVLANPTFAFILIITHHFQTWNMTLYSKSIKECRFWFKIFQNVPKKKSIFLTSEAPLLAYLQNQIKSFSLHDSVHIGQLSFGWFSWKSLGLNCSTLYEPTRNAVCGAVCEPIRNAVCGTVCGTVCELIGTLCVVLCVRVIQPERFSTESAKTKLSYMYWIM